MNKEESCSFCGSPYFVMDHHIIPKSKGGKITIPTCKNCENYFHKSWSHNQLRDVYNNIKIIMADEGFQKFLKWKKKQHPTSLFKSEPGKFRNKHKYN